VPEIVRLFHGSQIVPDVLEAGRFYHDFFGSWVYEAQHLETEDARNSSNVFGPGFSMEVLAPLDPDGPTGVARFLRRHGPHFNNVAFWARDCRGLAAQLIDRGIRVAVRGGAFSNALPDGDFDYVITHPKDTHGLVLEFLEDQRIHDPRDRPWWNDDYWRDRHPLGILGLSHCTVVVDELAAAAGVFSHAFGCECLHQIDDGRDAQSMFFELGDTVVELAAPTTRDSAMARHLAEHGPILYSFTFTVKDLARVAAHADANGLDLVTAPDGTLVLDPTQTVGGVYAFTERPGLNTAPR
jgi:hypothetical protein